jgi:hypothetical protein
MRFGDNGGQWLGHQSLIWNARCPNNLPNGGEFPYCFVVWCHWENACVAPRANVEFVGEISSMRAGGLAIPYESRECVMYTSQSESWAEVARVCHSRGE